MRQQSIRRAGTLIRSPMEGGKRQLDDNGKMCGSEVSSSTAVTSF